MDLLQLIKSHLYSRKIFGVREIKIIEKQLLGINLTQSEKNRLSRDIRKKLEFMKEMSKFSQQFTIKKGAIINELTSETKKIIFEDVLYKKIKQIIVFGSFVDKEMTFRSDIDVAVVFDKISPAEATLFKKRILSKVNPRMDIQVYNVLPEKIKEEINRKGRIIYQNES